MSKDFCESIPDFDAMLAEEDVWQITDGEFFSVKNMSDAELGESIVNDVLIATFYEKEGNVVDFTPEILVRFLHGPLRQKVLEKLQSSGLAWYFNTTNGQLRIKNDRNILQAAQDYAGVWYGDFEPTDKNTAVFRVNSGILTDAVKAYGSIDALATSLAMDLVSDVPVNQLDSKLVN